MQKSSLFKQKKIIVAIFVLIFIILLVFFNFYKKNKPIDISFEQGILVNNSNNKVIESNINANLKANISKGDFLIKELKFRENLVGTLTINNEKYSLYAFNLFKGTDNLFWGELKKNKEQEYPSYIAFISPDFKKIYLNDDINNKSIAIPAKSLNDFNNIKNYMLK